VLGDLYRNTVEVVLRSGQFCGWYTPEERTGDVQCWEEDAE
jgi:hypothetical protein